MSQNSVNNQTGTSGTNTVHSHIRSAFGQWHNYNDQTDAHGYYSGVGSPEGVVAADIGSYYSDTGVSAAGIYYKTTDTVNTGWVLAAPSSGAFTSIVPQIFTANGTYTPTVLMKYCIVECLGGGAAAGGSTATAAGQFSAGAGGGGGEYAVGVFSAATIGVSQAVTIGAGGVGVVGLAGGDGGNTSLGALISAFGGLGGGIGPGASANFHSDAGDGGTGGAGGDYRTQGRRGQNGYGVFASSIRISGTGADSQLGAGGRARTLTNNPGEAATGYGAAGGGAISDAGAIAKIGGAGTPGIVIITEYVA